MTLIFEKQGYQIKKNVVKVTRGLDFSMGPGSGFSRGPRSGLGGPVYTDCLEEANGSL